MNHEIKQNFEEKLRLVLKDVLATLDHSIETMLAEHSRDGLLGSGQTIKKTMDFISLSNADLYRETLNHVATLKLEYHPSLETELQQLASGVQDAFKPEALQRLKKSTEIARSPQLWGRMIPDVESAMAHELANFQNTVNAIILDLKLKNHRAPIEKALWLVEVLLVLLSMFIAGMWFKDPEGNYEPLLIGLSLIIPLIAVGIKFRGK